MLGTYCGDETINDNSEQCDSSDLGGYTCENLKSGFTGGALSCTSECAFDTSGCTTQTEPTCTDADLDGYAIEGDQCGPVDCNDSDQNINPGATEICDNEVDENCDGIIAICPSECENVIVVSNTDDDVFDTDENFLNPAVLAWDQNSAWTAIIDGANWIWKTYLVETPTQDETYIFEKNFDIIGVPASATLKVATDNSYKVWVNGVSIGEDTTEFNYTSAGQDHHDITNLHTGSNNIKFEVKNWASEESTAETNPAGLLYRLEIVRSTCEPSITYYACHEYRCIEDSEGLYTSSDCDNQCGEAPTSSITIYKYNDLNGNGIWDNEEPAISGWEVFLSADQYQYEGPDPITDSEGKFVFSNLQPKTYDVCEMMQDNWENTEPGYQPFDWGDGTMVVCYDEMVLGEGEIPVYFGNREIKEEPKDIPGCTDPDALNYNPAATEDDQSCEYPPVTTTTTTVSQTSGGATGGQYIVPAGIVAGAATERGQVAGASTSCGRYLLSYIKYGANNDPEEVKKLQSFLNEYFGLSLELSGIYNQETYQAVERFQLLLKDEILSPWAEVNCLPSEDIATGYVYRTTQRAINNIMCPSLGLFIPNVSDEQCFGGTFVGLGDGEGIVAGAATSTFEETTGGFDETTTTTVPDETIGETTTTIVPQDTGNGESQNLNWIWVLIGFLVVGGVIYFVYGRKRA